jgi:phosphatidylinositol alpha-1,6-mannosyltransferase
MNLTGSSLDRSILLVANIFPPIVGGSAIVYENMCRQLAGQVTVVTPWRSYVTGEPIPGWKQNDTKQPFAVSRVELLRPLIRPAPWPIVGALWRQIWEDLPLRARVRREVFRRIQELHPDIVCLGELHALSWLGLELKAKGVPVVHFIHGEEITTACQSKQMRREAEKALRAAKSIVAVSSFTREKLLELGLDPASIHLITNGVDTSRFTPGPRNETIMTRLGLHGKKVLLTVARLEEKKGQDNVIRAMPRILAAVPDAIYVVVGQGHYRDRIIALINELGLSDRVILAGPAEDHELREYYRTCDVFIMANRQLSNGDTEGFGLVFLEAAACCKPVIGGNAGGVPDAVIDRETGVLVDGQSPDQIAHAAIQLLSDSTLANGLARAGLERSKGFDWSSKAQEFLKVCYSASASSRH